MNQHEDEYSEFASISSHSSDEDAPMPAPASPILAALLAQPVPVPQHVFVEGIDEMAYMLWNIPTITLGAVAVFTCDYASICHFSNPGTAFRFVLTISSYRRTPVIVRMFPHIRENFDAVVNDMRQIIAAHPRAFE